MARLSWSVASDVGTVRAVNEDTALAQPPIFAVADGMGGHAGGDVASRLAIEALSTLTSRESVTRDEVADALAAANARILEFSAGRNSGTTVSGVAVAADAGVEHWLVFNVGDSRVYRAAAGQLVQLTTDHSEVQELVEGGWLDAAEIQSHELRNVVTRALGSDPAPEIDWWLMPISPGERFLVCSDGLTRELSDEAIGGLLSQSATETLARDLVRAAVRNGGRDNVTAIVVETVGAAKSEVDEDTRPRAGVSPSA